METLKHLVDNEIPNAEQTVNYQNADDNAKTNFDDAKRLANTLLNSDNTNVNDINGATKQSMMQSIILMVSTDYKMLRQGNSIN